MAVDVGEWIETHKPLSIGIASGLVLALGYRFYKGRQTAQTAAQYLTPNVLANVPTGETITITGPGNTVAGPAPVVAPVSTPAGNVPVADIPLPSVNPTPQNAMQPQIPQDIYGVGQLVNPVTGEKVVSAAYSPLFGWLNLTSLGGTYTGGGGTVPISQANYGGSYLGYVGSLPADQQASELAAHDNFLTGSLLINPAGTYTEINSAGERYTFGLPGYPGV